MKSFSVTYVFAGKDKEIQIEAFNEKDAEKRFWSTRSKRSKISPPIIKEIKEIHFH